MKKAGLFLLFILLGLSILPAQEVISPSGNSFQNQHYSLSFTLGELAVETYISDELTLTQGMHQPEISIVSVVEHLNDPFGLRVYPNPATDFINLQINDSDQGSLSYKLFNLSGQLLQSERIEKPLSQVSLRGHDSGYYLLVIYKAQHPLKTFRLLKK